MCHRFFVDEDTLRDIRRIVAKIDGDLREKRRGDVNPTDSAIVITGRAPGLAAEEMTWGFSRPGKNLRMINARTETALEKPSFAESVRRRRCVVPAAHFYEWDHEKNKVTFMDPEKRTLFLAGFYDIRENEEQFVILTTAANASMESVHDRMPLILGEDQITDWILDDGEARVVLKQDSPELASEREYEQLTLF